MNQRMNREAVRALVYKVAPHRRVSLLKDPHALAMIQRKVRKATEAAADAWFKSCDQDVPNRQFSWCYPASVGKTTASDERPSRVVLDWSSASLAAQGEFTTRRKVIDRVAAVRRLDALHV